MVVRVSEAMAPALQEGRRSVPGILSGRSLRVGPRLPVGPFCRLHGHAACTLLCLVGNGAKWVTRSSVLVGGGGYVFRPSPLSLHFDRVQDLIAIGKLTTRGRG